MEAKNFNAHAHCFTIDHVPEEFFDILIGGKRFLRISKIRNSSILRKLITFFTSGFTRWIVKIFSPNTAAQLKRLHGLIKYCIHDSQEKIIDILDGYYGREYRFVLLSMDMENMWAGKPFELFNQQIEKIHLIKKQIVYKDKIFPFVFADPRRPGIDKIVENAIKNQEAPFQGIKIYPALGYYPFDIGLKKIYEFAISNDLPVLTHCIDGPVFYRGNLWEQYPDKFTVHPASKQTTTPSSKYKDPAEFQLNLSHPLNYECLLNNQIASDLFGEPVDFSKLKICIGHFGGNDEWMFDKKQQAKKDSKKYESLFSKNPLDIHQKWLGNSTERYSWLKVIHALLKNKNYPNVYADISFTLHDTNIYPILKEMLKDPDINNRILFGTDFYVVAASKEEPDLITELKKYLTVDEIKLISYDNPLRFLNNKLNPILN